MIYRLRVPRPPLSFFVENLWFYQDLAVDHTGEKLLPDASMELIIDLGEGPKKLYDREEQTRHAGFTAAGSAASTKVHRDWRTNPAPR